MGWRWAGCGLQWVWGGRMTCSTFFASHLRVKVLMNAGNNFELQRRQRMSPFQCPSPYQVVKRCGMDHASTNLPLHEISLIHRAIVQVIKLPCFCSSTRNWKWKKNNVITNQPCHFGMHHLHQPRNCVLAPPTHSAPTLVDELH